jgi:undecaprenyl-phosphate 4-deoxy-4-formamido-L-arabinose transferase
MAGLNYSNGDYVVIMDDDFQNPPDEILTLINHAIKHDYDVVYSYYNQKEHSLFRNIGSWFNGIIANIMLDKPSELYLSSFKVLNRFIVNEVIRYSSPFIYIDGIIFQITSNIGKIEVKHNKRVIGKSNYTMKKLFLLWLNMFLSFSILPLRMSAFLGSIISCFGLIYAFIAIIEKFVNAELISGWTSLIVIISIFSGAQLMCIGVIGEYVGRIFISLNHKPQFTVRRGYSDEH